MLLVGAGGLGSPVALYLAAAGVGTLGIVDFDTVDLSNLQRQILHHGHDVGRPKVQSAVDSLSDINPDVKVVPYQEALSAANVKQIFADYDVIVNGSDNFPTRYLANDACVFLKKPLVDGSIFKFEGQATVFLPGRGCYRCLYPAPPPPGVVPSCAEAGVLGVICGVIASIQGVETIKLLLGLGELIGGPSALLRRPGDGISPGDVPARPGVPGVRRPPDHHRPDRLPGVLRDVADGAPQLTGDRDRAWGGELGERGAR